MTGVASRGAPTAERESAMPPRPPRIQGLDGIRALAAALVLGYHLVPGWRGAGYVGVDMFFVLSGFLITSLLLRETALRGDVRLKRFWVRRIRRLMPAVVFATIGTVALARIAGGDALVQLPWQVLGSLTSTYNWLQIANAAPYFGQRSPLLLANVWSLALEMQFYLIWPVLLLLILAFAPRKTWPLLAIGLAGLSAGWNWHLVHVEGDITRAYVGTDAHAFGLMLGAAIALSVPGVMVKKIPDLKLGARRTWGVLTWVGLAGALTIGIAVPNGEWMYPWGMLAASIFTALVIRGFLPDALSGPSNLLVLALQSRPMVWFGERSYSIYLWHWPLWVIAFFTFRRASLGIGFGVLIASLIMAEVSYRYVETPIRMGGLKSWLRSIGGLAKRLQALLVLTALAATALFVYGLISSPAKSSAEQLISGNEAEDVDAGPWDISRFGSYYAEKSAAAEEAVLAAEKKAEEEAEAARIAEEEAAAAAAAAAPVTGDQVTIIGDSVTLVSEPQLYERLPGVFIDSEVSRPMLNFPSVAQSVQAQGMMREYVVISLAINGFVRDQEIEAMFAALGPEHKIVLVTGFGPEHEHWIFDANAKIYEVAAAHQDQVRVADWAPIADANRDLLAGDLTHPGGAGSALYADEIVRALNSFD